MRSKKKAKIIYAYKKTKHKRKKSTKYIKVQFYLVVLFFSGIALLSILAFNNITNSPKETFNITSTKSNTIGVLSAKTKKTSNFFSWFPLYVNLPQARRPIPTMTPKPKPVVIIPAAVADEKTVNDFCLNVPVLFYHHIQPLSLAQQLGHAQLTVDSDYFDKQMAYLAASGYHPLSADELAEALISHHGLPAKSILVTFDDGYDDNYNYAFQILKKYNIAGNFMIPTGLIENNGYMTWSQLKEMAGNPLMHIYNHTWSHASLGGAAKDKIEYEIATANKQLDDNLGKRVNIFTYPYGSYNQLVIDVLREHGFTAAFSTISGTIQCQSYIFALRRTNIGNAPLSSYGF